MNLYRVGNKLGTTIYHGEESQPCAWVPGDPALAQRIVALLNEDARDAIRRIEGARRALRTLRPDGLDETG